tara:strand:- start:769 stop:1110 length:342 start_codon:yes stop_codon:yes gene_type:complete
MSSFLFIVIFLLAIVAVLANIMLIWYIRHVMNRSSLMRDVTSNMLNDLKDFLEHLDQVHELPLFYGDETIKDLLQHSRKLVEDIGDYRNGFIFGNEGEEFDNEREEGSSEEEE